MTFLVQCPARVSSSSKPAVWPGLNYRRICSLSLIFLHWSPQYVLNDKVSYPEGTFMDWEFKISVMYDISKVTDEMGRFFYDPAAEGCV